MRAVRGLALQRESDLTGMAVLWTIGDSRWVNDSSPGSSQPSVPADATGIRRHSWVTLRISSTCRSLAQAAFRRASPTRSWGAYPIVASHRPP